MRLMAVCHDSVGIGHLRRTMAIAERVSQSIPSCRVLVVSGTLHVTNFTLPERVDYVKLPSLCKGPDYRYCAKTLGLSFPDTIAVRSAILTATAASFRPDVLLIDKSPLGVAREAERALQLVRDRHPATRVIFGMRDIEDAPERTIQEWSRGRHLDALKHLCDEIWVYGDPKVFDVAEAYQLPPEVTAKLHYVGYIARPPCDCLPRSGENGDGVRRVLVTVGGGTDGFRFIDQYLADPVERVGDTVVQTTIVGGPDLPRAAAAQFRRRAAGSRNVIWRDILPCMFCEYKRSDVILTMGGYNTMIEVLQSGRPMLVYPRVEPRLEQYIRTRKFASLQLCEGLDPNGVTPARIRAAVEHLLVHGAAAPTYRPALDGLDNVALRLSQMEALLRDSMALCV